MTPWSASSCPNIRSLCVRASGWTHTKDPSQPSRIVGLPPDQYKLEVARRYTAGETPWDTGVPSAELVRVLEAGGLPGRTALEFGCGTGTNAIELARRGYKVTAIDLVEEPVAKAREKSRRAGVDVDFRVGDLTRAALGGPYDVLFDSGVYHGIRNRDLEGLLATAGRVTRPGSRWLSLAGNAREARPDGPPAVSEGEIRRELERDFRILELREFRFDLGPAFQPLAWSILMERK